MFFLNNFREILNTFYNYHFGNEGGYDGASCLSSVERFDPLTGIWSSCAAMSTRRRYCRVAVLDNCIYALGGFDSSNYQSSVERFDPRVGWMAMPSMTSRRSSCGVAALEYLYCKLFK